MQADRQAIDAQVDALEATCSAPGPRDPDARRDGLRLSQGRAPLSVENASLRGELGSLRALAAHARSPALDTDMTEARLPLNCRAAATARAIVVEFLRERVPYGLLDRAKLIVSELIAEASSEPRHRPTAS